MFSKNQKEEKISFSWGYPDLDGFPLKKLKQIVNEIDSKDISRVLQYHPGQGIPTLRNEIVKQKMGDFGNTKADEIIITPGATFGIFLLAYYFKNVLNYQKIGVFFPCYDTALQIFKIVGLEIIDLNKNKSTFKDLKCFYIMPRYSNPSGVNISNDNVKIVENYITKNNALVIEDDVYHIFNYTNENFKTFKQKFPKNVFYLDSFSKILAPGFRLGYIAADDDSIKKLIYLQMFICSSASTLNQEIVYQLIRDDHYSKIVKEICNHYHQKMRLTIEALKEESLGNKFISPTGGYYIWLNTDYYFSDSKKNVLAKHGVNLIDGRIYYNQINCPKAVRLSIANIAKDEIKDSIKTIKKYLYE